LNLDRASLVQEYLPRGSVKRPGGLPGRSFDFGFDSDFDFEFGFEFDFDFE
jgi:hypothetical protein